MKVNERRTVVGGLIGHSTGRRSLSTVGGTHVCHPNRGERSTRMMLSPVSDVFVLGDFISHSATSEGNCPPLINFSLWEKFIFVGKFSSKNTDFGTENPHFGSI